MAKDADQVWMAPDGKHFQITISFIEAMALLLKDLKDQDVYDARSRQLLEVETILMSCPNWIFTQLRGRHKASFPLCL